MRDIRPVRTRKGATTGKYGLEYKKTKRAVVVTYVAEIWFLNPRFLHIPIVFRTNEPSTEDGPLP